jgi:hypothetical protein
MLKSGGEAALILASPAERSIHLSHCASDAPQPFGEHFRIHAHADAKVVRHFEKAARNRGRFELGT